MLVLFSALLIFGIGECNWTTTRNSGIAVDTLDFFENLLSKSTKFSQCIQTNEVSRNLTSNFSEISYFCSQLLVKKGHESKTNKGQADQFPNVTPSCRTIE